MKHDIQLTCIKMDIKLWKQTELVLILETSSIALRNQVYKFARYFQKEFHYDFVQYHPTESFKQGALLNTAPFLFVDSNGFGPGAALGMPFGACCFRLREGESLSSVWAMQWIWLHPFFRHQGHLKGHWEFLRKIFGNFIIDPPLPLEMKAFLEKYGEIIQLGQTKTNDCK